MERNILFKYDLNTSCEGIEEFNFENSDLESIPNNTLIRFHPDGHIYILLLSPPLLSSYLYRYHPLRKEVNQKINLNISQWTDRMAISEEGRIILSSSQSGDAELYDYDLRQNQVNQIFDNRVIPGTNPKSVYGILKDGFFLIPALISSRENSGMWNPEAGEIKAFPVELEGDVHLLAASVLYPPCGDLSVYAMVLKNNNSPPSEFWISWGDTISNSMRFLCEVNSIALNAGTTPTDFRQSPLRIHLDANQSSGHMTGGYYDTLTTCRKEVPIADDDIELFTCGAEVDSVSFRLRYYDQPRLAAEYLMAEGSEANFRQTSTSRWVWENTYGTDEDQIKDFLRSIRYHADWDPEDADQSRERVVMTTMYVDGDSTTSWTVYQLEKDEVYAGRDTTVEYCSDGSHLDLLSYLSPGVDTDAGYFSPEPSGDGSTFITGMDPDGKYLYIIEKAECADTAVITLQKAGKSRSELDTVWLCPGERKRIGLPPGKYSYVEWWDGSRGDSLWVEGTAEEQHSVTVGFENCNIVFPVNILLLPASEVAGEDKLIPYCGDGGAFSLTEFLPTPEGYTSRLEPSLHMEDLTFTPGTDPPGEYLYILTPSGPEAGCPDTALITLEESEVGEIALEPVRLCDGSEVKTGLPAGTYDDVRWWNGDTGDSTLVTTDDAGDLWVEAMRDGCTYHGSFTAEVVPTPDFPDYFPDRLTICTGEEVRLVVEELDSVQWNDRTYDAGEEIVLTEEGNVVITGYLSGCAVQKEIQTELISDPSADYSEEIHFCEGESIVLTLPDDTPELSFVWADGTAGPERTEQEPGEYVFGITAGKCEYAGSYTLTLMAGQDGSSTPSTCTVSIPNAVSPNGDGINDQLEVFSDCDIQVTDIRLFDKWGGELYHVQGGTVGAQIWEELLPGVVMVQVRYETERGEIGSIAGGVLVVK